MKIIDFQKGLSFHRDSKDSIFFRDLKRIFDFSGIVYLDPCCPSSGVPFQPLRFNPDTGIIETFDGTDWVPAESNFQALEDGTAAAPALAFVSDTDTGIFKPFANAVGISAGGTSILEVHPNGIGIVGQSQISSGLVGVPSYSFSTDSETGMYLVGLAQIGFSANGTLISTITSTGLHTADLGELVLNAGVTMTGKLISDKGTITQIATKVTTVVLDKPAGVITTVALTDAADTSFEFTLSNTQILTSSVMHLTTLNSGTGVAHATITSIAAGSAVIRVNNVGIAAFNSAIKIHFTIS